MDNIHYDSAIVGSGVGGLTAAALLAKAGKHVIVLERYSQPGGYAQSFRRGGYLLDSSVHVVGGCEPVEYERGGLIHRVLEILGVRDGCTFVYFDPVVTINLS